MATIYYHRITAASWPEGPVTLDSIPGIHAVSVDSIKEADTQLWELMPAPQDPNKFYLHTLASGYELALDIINDGEDDTPRLAPIGNYSGQLWTLNPISGPNGTSFKLTNDFTGPTKFLEVRLIGDTLAARMTYGHSVGMLWTFNLAKVAPKPTYE